MSFILDDNYINLAITFINSINSLNQNEKKRAVDTINKFNGLSVAINESINEENKIKFIKFLINVKFQLRLKRKTNVRKKNLSVNRNRNGYRNGNRNPVYISQCKNSIKKQKKIKISSSCSSSSKLSICDNKYVNYDSIISTLALQLSSINFDEINDQEKQKEIDSI
eukprot:TRINITY_DN11970_c0_g1_i1.p1 TRINITY_DN11970_c0_g1~~TRINITY_DN11970_c0_g1_i1.p1  ORF type:complete len:167 (+),score=16.59 TRINITY_DN11970_c0_g1_i1:54-554(+)